MSWTFITTCRVWRLEWISSVLDGTSQAGAVEKAGDDRDVVCPLKKGRGCDRQLGGDTNPVGIMVRVSNELDAHIKCARIGTRSCDRRGNQQQTHLERAQAEPPEGGSRRSARAP
jgi:hypothetical protein